jgi:hypothetical protein
VHKVKSHKTIEDIAKKHRLEVSFVKNQLKMGIPIEHEHTKNKDLATDIALQHLDEIPDYYTRLKKMEASAKKSHKKFKDVTEAKKMKGEDPCWSGYQMVGKKKKGGKEVPNCVPIKEMAMLRYCPKCQKDETRDECKYGQKFWDMYSMPVNLKGYHSNSPHPGNFPESYDHEHSMARSELSTIASAVKRLKKKMKGEGNIEAWVQSKITKAADYIDTAADYVDSGEMKEELENKEKMSEWDKTMNKIRKRNEQGKLTDKQFVGALRRATKVRPVDEAASFEINPKEHKKKMRERKIRELERRTTSEGERKAAKLKLKGPELPPIRESYEYSNWRSEFGLSEQTKYVMPNASRPGYAGGGSKAYRVGEMIPASATKPSKEALFQQSLEKVGKNLRQKPFNEDWQKINRHDKTDGLSQKAVDAYRREHPGSKLQTAVTEKNPTGKRAKRRANFCRRMKGARSKLTSAKTARDSNSNINKALRRWRCH